VALATAATLLAGGLVAAPAAQAVPLVDTDERDGTVVTTRMQAAGDLIYGNTKSDTLYPVTFGYKVDLGWTGGTLRTFDGEVTLQKVGGTHVRRYPITVNAHGNTSDTVRLPGTINPGFYRVGIEFTAAVQRPDGQVNRHRVNVNNAETVSIRRQTEFRASIANPKATDGRPSRISGKVLALSINGDNLTWTTVRSGIVHLSYDPDGPWASDKKNVYVRELRIARDGTFTTVVPAHDRWWKITYAGNDRFADVYTWLPQGDHEGCGC
jgi:hypothetical protein